MSLGMVKTYVIYMQAQTYNGGQGSVEVCVCQRNMATWPHGHPQLYICTWSKRQVVMPEMI